MPGGGRPPTFGPEEFRVASRRVLSADALTRLDAALHTDALAKELKVSDSTTRRKYPGLEGILSLAEAVYRLDGFDDSAAGERRGRNARVIERIGKLMEVDDLPGRELLKGSIRAMFDEDTSRPLYELAPEWLLHIAAVSALGARGDSVAPEPAALDAAEKIVEMRREFYVGAREMFVIAFTELFRRLEVGPRHPTATVADIAVMAHAAYDGVLLRYLVAPELLDLDTAVEALTDMILAMTTVGAMVNLSDPHQAALVRAVLEGPDTPVSLAASAESIDLPADQLAIARQRLGSDEDFAGVCLEQLLGLGATIDVTRLVHQGKSSLANEALRRVATVASERPVLVHCAGGQADAIFDRVALDLVATALRAREGSAETDAINTARMLVALARSKSDWEPHFKSLFGEPS